MTVKGVKWCVYVIDMCMDALYLHMKKITTTNTYTFLYIHILAHTYTHTVYIYIYIMIMIIKAEITSRPAGQSSIRKFIVICSDNQIINLVFSLVYIKTLYLFFLPLIWQKWGLEGFLPWTLENSNRLFHHSITFHRHFNFQSRRSIKKKETN